MKISPAISIFLFEHKSYTDGLIHIQLLEYMLKIWQLELKQKKNKKLPIIIPLVLYHGSAKWKIKENFSSILTAQTDILSDEEFVSIVKNALPEGKGDIIMTLAEQIRNEGLEQGLNQGLFEGIEFAIDIKFGDLPESKSAISIIKNIKNVKQLKAIQKSIKKAKTASELIRLISR